MAAPLSKNEEDYLKALYKLLTSEVDGKVGTNQLAVKMGVTAASANNMLKKLKTKKLKLIIKLDAFLGHPKVDPHGDPIPDASGKISKIRKRTLAEVAVGETCKLVAVKDNSTAFLQYVTQVGLGLRSTIKVLEKHSFDNSITIQIGKKKTSVSEKFSLNVFVL